jgi:hypothetical protein
MAAVFVKPSGGQDEGGQSIAYGETHAGSISAESYSDLYLFQGRAGEIITITMTTAEGDLDPYVSLVDATGAGVAFSDDDGDGDNALLEGVRLPLNGVYYIIASRFGHVQGSTTGSYQLTLTRLGAAIEAGSVIQYGDRVIGEITNEEPQAIYAFFGSRGEVVNLRMMRTSGDLDAFLDLANASGQILLSGDDDPSANGTLDAGILNFTLPESGYYLIVATRYGRQSGGTNGTFLLAVAAIPEDVRGVAPSSAILLDYGRTVQSALNTEVPQRFYFFEGNRGDVVTLNMRRTAGNLNVVLLLLDAQLNELLREGYVQGRGAVDRAQITTYALPADGDYYVMAARADFAEGTTEGTFELSLTGRTGIAGSELLEIFYDTQTFGYIDDAHSVENFVFQGSAGDVISLRMEATSENLDPLLTLYQGNKQIAFNDDTSANNVNSSLLNFELPEDGLYRVQVSRSGRDSGLTRGGYNLFLEER